MHVSLPIINPTRVTADYLLTFFSHSLSSQAFHLSHRLVIYVGLWNMQDKIHIFFSFLMLLVWFQSKILFFSVLKRSHSWSTDQLWLQHRVFLLRKSAVHLFIYLFIKATMKCLVGQVVTLLIFSSVWAQLPHHVQWWSQGETLLQHLF